MKDYFHTFHFTHILKSLKKPCKSMIWHSEGGLSQSQCH